MEPISSLFFIILIITLSCTNAGELSSQSEDVSGLLAFKKSSVDSDPYGLLTGWVPTSSAPCLWTGVTCVNSRATVLDLTNAGLVGLLHLDILTALPYLIHIRLGGNYFSGNLTFQQFVCRLETLDLSLNKFSLPLDLSQSCDSLVYLNLSGNSIPGGSLSIGPNLLQLDLSRNRISKTSLLVDSLSNCQNLNLLNFSNNQMTGNLSSISFSCKNLGTLDLSSNLLTGEIPRSFLAQSLQVFDLSNNSFTGDFSSLEFGSCLNLTMLDLSHNSLFGTDFPVSLRNCQLLETVDVGYNNEMKLTIAGFFFGSFKRLRQLYLPHNGISGEIPPELGQICGSLEVLDLSGNNLSGGLPSTIAACSSLFSLNLGYNQLSGNFLGLISRLPSLKYLYLPFNNITGPVPLSLANITQLQVLDLGANALTGNVPSGFCSSTSSSTTLERLYLSNNYLTGKVPSELGKCRNLKTIDLSFNNLVGEIPFEIWSLPNLSELVMWANNLGGEIPEGICNIGGNLQTLILNNNLISGTLPLSIGNCTNLLWVSLSNNHLTGEIPSGIGNLVNLAILQMAINNLTGEIPKALGNCRSLIWLDLFSNDLTGPIPLELADNSGLIAPGFVSGKQFAFVRNEGGTSCLGAGGLVEFKGIRANTLENYRVVHSCPSTRIYTGVTVYTFQSNGTMMYLDLSYNSLSGTIPENLGSLTFLQVLNLGHNKLTGTIPSSLGNLKAVGVLDLSHNHLEGFIPGSLGGLSFVTDLDVSNNNLTGSIPSGGQLTTFPASRYANNSGLCGLPLSLCGSRSDTDHPPGVSHHREHKQEVTAEMVIGIGGSVLCIIALLFALYRIKKHQKEKEKREKYIESLPTSGSSSWKLSAVPEPLSINVATFEKPLRKLTFAHLLEATNGFSNDSLIGSGGFGVVYRAQLGDGCVVAIKKLIHATDQGDREFMAEMETIGKIKHRNLVPLLGYCKIGEERLLVYEYMKWGSLESVLHEKVKNGESKLDWAARKKIAIGSARGLAFLHHSCIPHIIHRDMKSSNVLLDEDFEARVSDFGMARLVNALDTHLSVSTLAGTPGYVPPEYYQSFRCTTKGDVYSYGVILLELLSGKKPIDPLEFGDDNNLVGWAKQLHKEKRSHEILDPELNSHESSRAAELYQCLRIAFECLDDRPFRRPTMIQVMAMFKDLQTDSESDVLDGISLKNTVIEERQEKQP
ncbi:hypothetical protein RHGRI_018831 [Rhododendron griersonianum]|uniref:non-specific serine/threonine protein kinase n=1 Tax=Rhododendron griersonianum TaxID=479676 RepID=A0AAV6K2V9_9ERIC|nr:hypothetical protein RHGRI_018831 [Rhododendron griersonianum]